MRGETDDFEPDDFQGERDSEDERGFMSVEEQLAADYAELESPSPTFGGCRENVIANMRHALGLDWRPDARQVSDAEILEAAKDAHAVYTSRRRRLLAAPRGDAEVYRVLEWIAARRADSAFRGEQ